MLKIEQLTFYCIDDTNKSQTWHSILIMGLEN